MGVYIWTAMPPLNFTANTAGSTIALNKTGNPTAVTLETSTDGTNWSAYTFGNTITLSNVGDKVYFRNTSETTTGFSTNTNNFYMFAMNGSIAASGDINYLLNKNSTTTVSSYCYSNLFSSCSALTSTPSFPATTLDTYCYRNTFYSCWGLKTIPALPATFLPVGCYYGMFYGCTQLGMSTTKTGVYQNEYRIPTTGTGTTSSQSLEQMFYNTGLSTSTPSINTTYYTSSTVV